MKQGTARALYSTTSGKSHSGNGHHWGPKYFLRPMLFPTYADGKLQSRTRASHVRSYTTHLSSSHPVIWPPCEKCQKYYGIVDGRQF